MSLVVDPAIWRFLPHGDEGAWLDFVGFHALLHAEYAQAIRRLGRRSYPALPLAPTVRITPAQRYAYYPDDLWHQAHQIVSEGEASSLSIAAPPDMRSYELADPEQIAAWALVHSNEMVRIRQAIGI